MPSPPTLLRLGAVVSMLAGLLHLAFPNKLLNFASWGYSRVLAVRFQPRNEAPRRVRLVGVGMVLVAPVLTRLAAWIESRCIEDRIL